MKRCKKIKNLTNEITIANSCIQKYKPIKKTHNKYNNRKTTILQLLIAACNMCKYIMWKSWGRGLDMAE